MFAPLPLLLGFLLCFPTEAAPPSAVLKTWQKGQEALDADRLDEAIGQFQLALRLDPTFVRTRLSLAAAYLAQGNDRQAIPHLGAYLLAKPDHFLVRMPYAEVLLRVSDYPEARRQLELFVASIQDNPRLASEHLVTCHTKIMEVAEKQGDECGERLHRGIGLYLLALKRLEVGGSSNAIAEELLCKSAAELTLVRMLRPRDVRSCAYLHLVWNRLGQTQPGQRALRAANDSINLDFGQLTPSEHLDLHLRLATRDLSTLRR